MSRSRKVGPFRVEPYRYRYKRQRDPEMADGNSGFADRQW